MKCVAVGDMFLSEEAFAKVLKNHALFCSYQGFSWKADLDRVSTRTLIRNIETMGPYIVLAQGFALPHESPDVGGKKLGMQLIRLKHPVPFHSQFYDPVDFVCCLSTIDKDSHLKAMFHLMNLLSKADFCENIRKAKTAEEVYQIFYEYESIL